jgi:glycine/D-amino acid oxidase-like deaminating enzyme
MQDETYDIVVIGAGIVGIAAAYALTRAGMNKVAIIDQEPPLSVTSDKSTECYRNFWPGPDNAMLALINDSIGHLAAHTQTSGDRFQMQQRGYLFATTRSQEIEALAQQAVQVEEFGGGALRWHNRNDPASPYQPSPDHGISSTLDGADLITDRGLIQQQFPYLHDDTAGVLHVRNCGSLSAQQLGMYLLEETRDSGAKLISGEFTGIETSGGKLSGITIENAAGRSHIKTGALVLATGPHLKATAASLGAKLPIVVEKHVKISIADHLGIIPRDAPLTIWNDPIDLPWSDDERELLAASSETEHLLKTFPAGVHGRPVGAGNQVLMYWTYDSEISDKPTFPIEPDPYLPEVTLRGMACMVPGLNAYLDPMPKPYIDGGYYTKTPDNRPLIGPLEIPGTYVCSAFSGYGIMASCAGGELLAAHVLGKHLPDYASAFKVNRFDDPAYVARLSELATSGQL